MADGAVKIEAIVSDFGGVLTTPLVQSFMAFQDRTGITGEALGKGMQAATEANGGSNPLFEMERGEISEAVFLERLTAGLEPLLGHAPEMHSFKEIYFEALEPNAPMIDLMRELKDSGYRMAMLTNNVREWEPWWRPMLPVDEIFETVVDSGFVGCRKPESKIYEIVLDRISLPAESCLFVDDVKVNCEGAEKAGMSRGPLPGHRPGDRRRARRARLAAQRIVQRSTGLAQPDVGQRGDAAAESVPSDRVNVVEIDHAVGGDTIVGAGEDQLRGELSPGSRQRGHDNGLDPVGNWIARQDQDRPIAAGSRGKPDLTPSHRPNQPNPLLAPSRRSGSGTSPHRSAVSASNSQRHPHCEGERGVDGERPSEALSAQAPGLPPSAGPRPRLRREHGS